MQALFLLLGISIVVLGVAGWAFLWAVNRGQFDDLDRHALDVLDDQTTRPGPARRRGRRS